MLHKYQIKEIKELAEKVRNGEADESEFMQQLRENADDLLNMAEKSVDLEFENERLNSKLRLANRPNYDL